MKKVTILLMILCISVFSLFPEVLVLNDRSVIQGKITKTTDDAIFINSTLGELKIDRKNIKKKRVI